MSLIDTLFPQVNAASVVATNTALDTAAARPFAVTISIDSATQTWLSLILGVALIVYVVKK